MTRSVLNINLNAVEYVRRALDCKAETALRLAQLYGYLEHVTSMGCAVSFKQSAYARKLGFSRNTVAKDLETLQAGGWVSYSADDSGTRVTCHGIPFETDDEIQRTDDRRASGAHQMSRGCSPDEQGGAHGVSRGCSPDEQGGCSRGEQGGAHAVSNTNKSSKNLSKNPPEEERPTTSRNLQKELIAVWNEHSPKAWPALKSISPSRERSIKALGGYRAVIELLPDALRGANSSKFWREKPITWENIVGQGTTPKGHLHALAESAPSSPTSDSGPYHGSQEHPDFFPPCPVTGDMRPKHGFKSLADRTEALESARAFYSQHSKA